MYLLDTHVVSELRKLRPHGAVLAWVASVEDAHLHVAAVTLGEIQAGIELTRDQAGAKAQEIEAWLDLVAQTYNVLPMDSAAFRTWANLMHCRSDAWYEDARIAAIAKTNGLTVVTRNVSDFAHFGVSLLNPFEGGAPGVGRALQSWDRAGRRVSQAVRVTHRRRLRGGRCADRG